MRVLRFSPLGSFVPQNFIAYLLTPHAYLETTQMCAMCVGDEEMRLEKG